MKICIEVPDAEADEFRGQLVDVVEDFLDAKVLAGDWRVYRLDTSGPEAMITGRDYDKLASAFMSLLKDWSCQTGR